MTRVTTPIFLLQVLKKYIVDVNRLWKISEEELKNYQDKQLKKMVTFAYTVPVYYEKYEKAGISPDAITGTVDLKSLPIVTKSDLQSFYPEGIYSRRSQPEKLIEISTSGTTGKSLSLYVTIHEIITGLLGYLRALKEYNINWRKTKITIIGDFASHTAESGYVHQGLKSLLKNNILFQNIQWLNTNDNPKTIIKKINLFKPQFIGGYVGMLAHLALLKEKGLGKKITPTYIGSTGAVLSVSLKKFIEKSFGAPVFEIYGATESGPIAIQCKQGNYHVLSDLVFLEMLRNKISTQSGHTGKLLITKLYGRGTPIIRYNSINDIITLSHEACSCGMSGEIIGKIYGRDNLSIYSPDGGILLPCGISEIFGRVLYELKSTQLKDTKVIQHSLENIEIQLVLEKNQGTEEPSKEKIFSVIADGFQKKMGSSTNIMIKEVEKIDSTGPRIATLVTQKDIKPTYYI